MADKPSDKCLTCGKTAFIKERIVADGKVYHANCFKCAHCNSKLSLGKYAALEGKYYCKPHFKQLFALKGNYNEGFGSQKHSKNWEPTVAAGAFKGVGSVIKGAAEGSSHRDASPNPRASEHAHGTASPSLGHHNGSSRAHSDFSIEFIIKEQGVEVSRQVLAC